MTCPDCTRSATELWHGYRSGCKGCKARAVARGPQFFEAREEGKRTRRYRSLLAAVGLTHDQVLEAHKIETARKAANAGEQPRPDPSHP